MSAAAALLWIALGETPGTHVEWNVPCGAVAGTPAVTARVDVTRAQTGWQLDVSFSAPVVGRRSLAAPTCEDAALAAVLLLQVAAAGGSTEPPMVEAQAELAPAAVAPAHEVRVWLSGGATTGTAPEPTPRIAVGVAVDLAANLSFEAQFEAGIPARFAGGPSATSAYQLWPVAGGTLAVCGMLRFSAVRLMACPAAQLEAIESEGLDITTPRVGFAAWLAVGADARATVELGDRLFAHLALGARVALNRPVVTFQRFGTAFETPLFSGGGEIGVGLRW